MMNRNNVVIAPTLNLSAACCAVSISISTWSYLYLLATVWKKGRELRGEHEKPRMINLYQNGLTWQEKFPPPLGVIWKFMSTMESMPNIVLLSIIQTAMPMGRRLMMWNQQSSTHGNTETCVCIFGILLFKLVSLLVLAWEVQPSFLFIMCRTVLLIIFIYWIAVWIFFWGVGNGDM